MKNKEKMRAGLIGEKLGHSFSPQIHAALADYSYDLVELEKSALGDFLRNGGYDAFNVTIPYKQSVIPYLAHVSDEAARIGAVNTVVRREDGSLAGYNTDYAGFCDLVRSLDVELANKKVLVLGSGGASRTAVAVAEDMGAREVVIVSRSGENNYENIHRHADAEILINATPVGMYPGNGVSPLSLDSLPRLEAVFDAIYNPAKTKLLQDAAARGIRHANGLLMLVSQARRAAEIFLGKQIPDSEVTRIAQMIQKQTLNVVLVGMPGCGKSTLGKLLAAEMGRPFVDLDEEIVKRAGRPIPQIFSTEGEEGFRALESKVVADICRGSGLVIATGGGVVTREENLPLLSQNGRVIFLDTPPEGLPTAGRPLSQSKTPEALYRERLPLYKKAADVVLPITRDLEENMRKLREIVF